jgi:lysophospholipase
MISEPFEYLLTPDGGRMRYKFWPSMTSPQSGDHTKTIILMQGRASFVEKFLSIITQLQKRGYHVWSFDWRGQGLSSRLTGNPQKGYIDSYETYLQDFTQLLYSVILPKVHGPLLILGQSMGSHIALRFLERYPGVFDGAFLTAPMLELNTGGYGHNVAQLFVKTACKLGFKTCFVPGHSSYDPSKEPFEGNLLTHDRKSFLEHRDLQKKNPILSVGGATYGWTHATFQSMAYLNNPEVLGRINVPVYALLAGDENVVDNTNARSILSWIPGSEYKVYEGARHQLLSESPCYMKRFWDDLENFTARFDLENNGLSKGRLVETTQLSRVQRIYPTLPNDFQSHQAHP